MHPTYLHSIIPWETVTIFIRCNGICFHHKDSGRFFLAAAEKNEERGIQYADVNFPPTVGGLLSDKMLGFINGACKKVTEERFRASEHMDSACFSWNGHKIVRFLNIEMTLS